MGGGNGQKAKMARERAQEKLKGAKALGRIHHRAPPPVNTVAMCKNLEKMLLSAGMLIDRFHVDGSQLESNKKAMTIQCKVCMQTFMCTTNEVKCREHAEAKHPKTDVTQCFPHLIKS